MQHAHYRIKLRIVEEQFTHFWETLPTNNIKFALSNVLSGKGKTNDIFAQWLICRNYHTIHLNCSYSNSNLLLVHGSMLAPFDEYFPDVAKAETRSVSISAGSLSGLPPDEYAFLELYCNEAGCDCRRVRFCVISRAQRKPVAHIDYGWETQAYYHKWLKEHDWKLAGQMTGVTLDPMQTHSNLAPALLTFVKDVLLQDSQYIARLKQHYQMMRKKFDGRSRAGGAQPLASEKLSKAERNKRTKQKERLLQDKKRAKKNEKKEKQQQTSRETPEGQRKIPPLQQVKLAVVMEEMANTVLCPSFSDNAENMAIMLASYAWNQANGAKLKLGTKAVYKNIKESDREDPTLWNNFIDSDVDVLIDKLKDYKQKHYPDDDRIILGISSQEHPDDPDAWRVVVASASKSEFEKWQNNPESVSAEEINRFMATYKSP